MHKGRYWSSMSCIGRGAASVGIFSVMIISMAAPADAAECPPGRPLCRLFSTSTTTPAAPAVTAPAVPPSTVAPPPPPPAPVPAAPRVAPEAARRLLDLVNAERARAGLGRLTNRGDVEALALAHSQRMVATGTIFHNDSYFTDSVRRLLNSQARGENVAQNTSVDDTHARLMNSPGHRANILDPRFTVAGFAVVHAADGRYFTTQNFLQPAGAVAAAPAAPAARPAPAQAAPRPEVASVAAAEAVSPTEAAEMLPHPASVTTVELTEDAAEPASDVLPRSAGSSSPRTWLAAGSLLGFVSFIVFHMGRKAPRRFSTIP